MNNKKLFLTNNVIFLNIWFKQFLTTEIPHIINRTQVLKLTNLLKVKLLTATTTKKIITDDKS